MEAVNETLKLVAQAKEMVNNYLRDNDIFNHTELKAATFLLDKAIEKLAVPGST